MLGWCLVIYAYISIWGVITNNTGNYRNKLSLIMLELSLIICILTFVFLSEKGGVSESSSDGISLSSRPSGLSSSPIYKHSTTSSVQECLNRATAVTANRTRGGVNGRGPGSRPRLPSKPEGACSHIATTETKSLFFFCY